MSFYYRRYQNPFSEENLLQTRTITGHILRWLKVRISKALKNELPSFQVYILWKEVQCVCWVMDDLILNIGRSSQLKSAALHLRNYLGYYLDKLRFIYHGFFDEYYGVIDSMVDSGQVARLDFE
jgi:hypothetical protein